LSPKTATVASVDRA